MIKTPQLIRSLLFVPGHAQKHIEKSATTDADAIVFDLEDAVSPAEKTAARQRVVAALHSNAYKNKQLIVRVNGLDTPWFKDDVQAMLAAGCCNIMLPKCESAEDIISVRACIAEKVVNIFAIIESARGVLAANDIASNLAPTDGLCFGHIDFAADMGLPNTNPMAGAIYHARCQIALAARAFGCMPIDNICAEIRDIDTIHEETDAGINIGYVGKLCIHPAQIDTVNVVYTPTAEQMTYAKDLLQAWDEAQEKGVGVFSYQNKMIDLPVILAQKSILQRYQAAIEKEIKE